MLLVPVGLQWTCVACGMLCAELKPYVDLVYIGWFITQCPSTAYKAMSLRLKKMRLEVWYVNHGSCIDVCTFAKHVSVLL